VETPRGPLILEGERVRLEPLSQRHAGDLYELCNDPALWEFTFSANPLTSLDATRRWIDETLAIEDAMPFAVIERGTGRAIGSTRFLEIEPEHRKLEIGWTFLARRFWRTHVNTECKLLLLTYAFESWKALRVQFKAEARNRRSQAAIAGIGAVFEGMLRSFRIRPSDGTSSTVALFSIVAVEWPAVRERLLVRGAD
jgi:RimJ/RimL family protein N-acetyltransferase